MSKHSKSSRRGFLKRASAVTVAAAGFPYVIPSSAYGAAGSVAPSDRINLAFIGMGKLGREAHLRSFLSRGQVQVVAVCDAESERLEKSRVMADEHYAAATGHAGYKGCAKYADFREMLARPDIDAVVIATPDHWHAFHAIHAAKAGKDIYCEKPLTRTIQEGRKLVDTVRQYGRVFQTGSQQRSEYNGNFRRAAEYVRNGYIGELKSVDINVGPGPGDGYGLPEQPKPETLDWNMWLGPAPWRPYSSQLCPMNFPGFPHWRYYKDYAGGSFSDFGAHHFDIAQWALGMDASGPVEIYPRRGNERMTFVYANGIPMHHGGEASVVFNGTEGKILATRGFIRAEPESILQIKLKPGDVHLGRGVDHRGDWLDCIRTRRKPIADVEIGHRTSTVCQLGNIMFEVDRPLKWDPVNERFIDDDEANSYVARTPRSPWTL